MSINKIERGRYKVVATVWPNLKKEATVNGSLDDAKAKELELKKELKAKKASQESERSLKYKKFGECLDLYDEDRTWGDSTFNHLKENLSHVHLPVIWEGLKDFADNMLNNSFYGEDDDKEYTPPTVNRCISMAKTAVSKAFTSRKIEINYLSRFPTLKENNIKYRTLNTDEKKKLFSELAEHLKPLFYFAIRIPCRAGELVNLKKSQYNSSLDIIIIEDGETKNGDGRWLPVFPEMKAYFDSIPEECDYLFYRQELDGSYKPLGYEKWSKKLKKAVIIPNFKKGWNNANRRAKIEGYNAHKMRQEAAMGLLYEGYTELEVMMIGGWKSIDAFRRYVRADRIMLFKKLGTLKQDDSWKKELAPRKMVA